MVVPVKIKEMKLSQTQLKRLLHYDCDTGVFTRLVCLDRRYPVGSVANSRLKNGYVRIKIRRIGYMAHRLAWLWMTGGWPGNEIDHRNGIRHDNRFTNLRDVTSAVNKQNLQKAQRNNRTGLLGVRKLNDMFGAKITLRGKTINLGRYLTPELAHDVYLKAKRDIHEGCTL